VEYITVVKGLQKEFIWNIPKNISFLCRIIQNYSMDKTFEELLGDVKVEKISDATAKVFRVIHSKWPVNPNEVAEIMGDNGKAKTLSAKYLYHFKKLAKKELIHMKKVGNTYIAWPAEIEKLRVIHELLRGI
jgi:hypothetical protein